MIARHEPTCTSVTYFSHVDTAWSYCVLYFAALQIVLLINSFVPLLPSNRKMVTVKATSFTPRALIGIGNPLLDILASVPNSFIAKYKLELNNMYLAEKHHMPLYREMQNEYDVLYVPGGATQNSIRICNALFNKRDAPICFSGCIGNDSSGEKMKALLKEEGVEGFFVVDGSAPTGECAVLINADDRALCTNLGAANCYPLNFLKEQLWPTIEKSDIVYSAGYFITVCFEGMMECGKLCSETGRLYCTNLSAIFILEFFYDKISQVLPYVDVLFGNAAEYRAFAKSAKFGTDDLEEIGKRICSSPKESTKNPRLVVITQSANPVIVLENKNNNIVVTKFPVKQLAYTDIVDCNGAGDAFVGGFMYGLMNKLDIDHCVAYGNHAASHILRHSGCAFTDEISNFSFSESVQE
ncbi:kinase, pfkB family protein [Cardiosporidium cionae]|uniref:adenosine kinase n=1 Tax=Cardiosporidium cionae TaxID=476202 RepID=A0ABQ7JDY9_9APIC|nr:kinase, pfkB family protein [Cardiosporidium cionae]|eukprot:KAF8822089.1 kinase, pfkB family protein [Cardiosporidium cionae]